MILYRGCCDRCALNRPVWRSMYAPPDNVHGRWFTDQLDIAEWYEADAPHGIIVVVDVPDDVVHNSHLPQQPRTVQFYSRDPEHEFFLPTEWAERATPLAR